MGFWKKTVYKVSDKSPDLIRILAILNFMAAIGGMIFFKIYGKIIK